MIRINQGIRVSLSRWTGAQLITMVRLMADIARTGNARRHWRFAMFAALLAVGWTYFIPAFGLEQGLLAGFDGAALLFLIVSGNLLWLSPDQVRGAAPADDLSRAARLAISLLPAVVIFAAMAAQIAGREGLDGGDKLLVVATLVLVWLFANTVFALHYAHLYYSPTADGSDSGGLLFPGTAKPDFADFAYFAFTIGVAVQTADVEIASRRIRRVVTIHAILGFFFNIGVLALSIGVLGSA
jgi:uncharacterized membrane protein